MTAATWSAPADWALPGSSGWSGSRWPGGQDAPDRNHFASWTGTAPIDASSGEHVRQRLSRGGNRQINRVLPVGIICPRLSRIIRAQLVVGW